MITIIKTITLLAIGFAIGQYRIAPVEALEAPALIIEYHTDICASDDIGLVRLTVSDVEDML